MIKIQLPALNWFEAGNIYTGSCRIDPTKGCLNQSTFHYQVKITQNGQNKYLTAVCYFKLPWNEQSNMKEATLGCFQADEFGIEVAQEWLLRNIRTDTPENRSAISPPALETHAMVLSY